MLGRKWKGHMTGRGRDWIKVYSGWEVFFFLQGQKLSSLGNLSRKRSVLPWKTKHLEGQS